MATHYTNPKATATVQRSPYPIPTTIPTQQQFTPHEHGHQRQENHTPPDPPPPTSQIQQTKPKPQTPRTSTRLNRPPTEALRKQPCATATHLRPYQLPDSIIHHDAFLHTPTHPAKYLYNNTLRLIQEHANVPDSHGEVDSLARSIREQARCVPRATFAASPSPWSTHSPQPQLTIHPQPHAPKQIPQGPLITAKPHQTRPPQHLATKPTQPYIKIPTIPIRIPTQPPKRQVTQQNTAL